MIPICEYTVTPHYSSIPLYQSFLSFLVSRNPRKIKRNKSFILTTHFQCLSIHHFNSLKRVRRVDSNRQLITRSKLISPYRFILYISIPIDIIIKEARKSTYKTHSIDDRRTFSNHHRIINRDILHLLYNNL